MVESIDGRLLSSGDLFEPSWGVSGLVSLDGLEALGAITSAVPFTMSFTIVGSNTVVGPRLFTKLDQKYLCYLLVGS